MSGVIPPFPLIPSLCAKEINKDFVVVFLYDGTPLFIFFLDRSFGSSRSNWKSSVNGGRKRSWKPSRKKISMNTVLSLLMKLNGS
jgi:rRNA maturation protein Rpf1